MWLHAWLFFHMWSCNGHPLALHRINHKKLNEKNKHLMIIRFKVWVWNRNMCTNVFFKQDFVAKSTLHCMMRMTNICNRCSVMTSFPTHTDTECVLMLQGDSGYWLYLERAPELQSLWRASRRPVSCSPLSSCSASFVSSITSQKFSPVGTEMFSHQPE